MKINTKYGHKSVLNKHIKTVYENLKPFQCNLCPATFGQKNPLNQHIETVHEKLKNFECRICSRAFGYQQNLKTHNTCTQRSI